ncbi:MAG: SulP family inorganic anion transporter, partial [Cyanobacteria bacterium J06641_5]
DPKVGLYASAIMAIIIAIVGGRPGMISAATGAMALLMTGLVKDYGLDYLFAAGILTGIFQIVLGFLRIGRQMKYVPRAVLIGFVNALALLIFMAQMPQLTGVPWTVYGLVGLGLGIIYLLPRLTTAVPSPLIAIITLTLLSLGFGLGIPTVGDMGSLPTTLPPFRLPDVPLNLETLQIILPTTINMTVVGLLDSFLTASVVDEMTDTGSNKDQEAKGQGIANIIANFFGGMAGCGMIGQSIINIKSGGRGRLSTLSAGALLMVFMLLASKWVEQIPMAALVAVMIMVSIGTFNWGSITNVSRIPKSETLVTVATVVVTLVSRNLAIGSIFGVALSAICFSREIAKTFRVESQLSPDARERIYYISGQLFFVSVDVFLEAFDFRENLALVVLDLKEAHLWDQSAIAAIDRVALKFRRRQVEVRLIGLNEASAELVDRLAIHDKPGALEREASH